MGAFVWGGRIPVPNTFSGHEGSRQPRIALYSPGHRRGIIEIANGSGGPRPSAGTLRCSHKQRNKRGETQESLTAFSQTPAGGPRTPLALTRAHLERTRTDGGSRIECERGKFERAVAALKIDLDRWCQMQAAAATASMRRESERSSSDTKRQSSQKEKNREYAKRYRKRIKVWECQP